jgi:hypothetical protein
MNDSEFFTLLNLYLDHEISPEDAARLDAVVAREPRRRRIYGQYCRMQRACEELAQRAPGEVAAFAARPARGLPAGLWFGGLAAACLAATLIVERVRTASPAPERMVAVAAAQGAAVADSRPAGGMQPVFVPGLTASPVSLPSADLNTNFAWMNSIQLAPLQPISADKFFPESSKSALELDTRGVEERSASPAETTAFQFQR